MFTWPQVNRYERFGSFNMSLKIFSESSWQLLEKPQIAKEEQIKTFEAEVKQLITDILKKSSVTGEVYKQYKMLGAGIHKVAEQNPQLKGIDEAFKAAIGKMQPQVKGGEAMPPPAAGPSTKRQRVAPPVKVPRPIRDNPVNKKEQQAWIEAHDQSVRPALTVLTDNIRHVSQKEFETSLKATTQRLNGILEKEGGEYVVAVEKEKSNQWVAQLALPDLSKKPMGEASLVFQVYLQEYAQRKASNPETPFPKSVVLFDDAAYSGEQLSRVIRGMILAVNTYNERAKNKVPMPKFIVAAPYMTKFAEDAIKEKVRTLDVGKESASKYLEIVPYERIRTIKELIPDAETLDVLTQMWWPGEAEMAAVSRAPLGGPPPRGPFMGPPERGPGYGGEAEFMEKDVSPGQFFHKKGVESRGTTYFAFKVPDKDSFVLPFAEGKVVKNGVVINPKEPFEIIPLTVPPYKTKDFAKFCAEIAS
jgi:hypothetical protein